MFVMIVIASNVSGSFFASVSRLAWSVGKRLGAILGCPGAILGRFGVRLGAILTRLGAILGRNSAILGPAGLS